MKTDQNILLIRQAKGNKDRVVMLSSKLIELLREYYKIYNPTKYLFEGPENKKYSQRSVQQIMKTSLKKPGLDSHASVRTLRHSYATHLLGNGLDIRIIKELLEHNSIKNNANLYPYYRCHKVSSKKSTGFSLNKKPLRKI
ncbi:tyrosine-type recombinase/integrase [Chryseobacterium sp. CY353]|nr:tyrosine-type recombinase/integrase [Chryseobacterium sp. CY353]